MMNPKLLAKANEIARREFPITVWVGAEGDGGGGGVAWLCGANEVVPASRVALINSGRLRLLGTFESPVKLAGAMLKWAMAMNLAEIRKEGGI